MSRSSRHWRTAPILILAAVTAVLIAVTAAALSSAREQHGEDVPEAGSIESVAEELAVGQARERAELNASLASAAEVAHGHLGQVLQDLTSAVSGHETDESALSADGPDEWENKLDLAISALDALPDGTSEQTVAREAFVGAASLLQWAVADYEHLLIAPAEERKAHAATVVERRDAAVRLWQAGAAQLDTLTVESGGGHVHLFLALNGDPDAVPLEFQEPDGH